MSLVLNDYKDFYPESWKPSTSYDTTLYILDELKNDSEEYQNIKKLFTSQTPTLIHRIQHPTAYLRYTVQSEFLKNENIHFTERMAYFIVDSAKIDVCISYNCDNRVLSGHEKPQLSPPSHLGSDKRVVIIQMRQDSNIDTDKNHYPIYAIQF